MEKDLFWYDIEKRQMFKFRGERLEFRYAMDNSLPKPKNRLLPKVISSIPPVIAKKVVQSSRSIDITIESEESASDVHKWFKKYRLRNPTDADVDSTYRKTVLFTVPLEEAEDFIRDATKHGLTFEV
jgi:hypothetical protein